METGWLIERRAIVADVPTWLYFRDARIDWTADVNEACRFARQVDAETLRDYLARLLVWRPEQVVVTEHAWR